MVLETLRSAMILFGGLVLTAMVGFPLAYLLRRPAKKDRRLTTDKSMGSADLTWVLSLFMGYGVIVGVLKLLMWIDLPPVISSWILLIIAMAGFVLFIYQQRRAEVGFKALLLPSVKLLVSLGVLLLVMSTAYLAVGATHYRLYSPMDLIYYSAQAEVYRTTPFSEMSALSGTTQYYKWGLRFIGGHHRLSMALFQGFVATVFGVDGASILGLSGILSIVLVFGALLYITQPLEMKPWYRYVMCVSGALLPGVATMPLNGFIPLALSASFQIVSAKLLVEVLSNRDWRKTLIIGVFFAASLQTFLESLYVVVGLTALVFVVLVFTGRFKWKSLLHVGAIYGIAAGLNAPILQSIWEELTNPLFQARTYLNGIAPNTYSRELANLMFWGNSFAYEPNSLLLSAISLLAIALMVVGFIGLVNLVLVRGRPEGLLMAALAALPLVFFALGEDYSYTIYKLTCMAMPVVVVGVYCFFGDMLQKAGRSLKALYKTRAAVLVQKVLFKGVLACLIALFAVTSSISGNLVLESIYGWNPNSRQWALIVNETPDMVKIYDALKSQKDKNILLILPQDSTANHWMFYYGRNNHLYVFLENEWAAGQTPEDAIPEDVQIMRSPVSHPMITDGVFEQNFAASLLYFSEETATWLVADINSPPLSSEFRVRAFARSSANAMCVLQLSPEYANISLKMDGITYQSDADGKLNIPLQLQAGGTNNFSLHTADNQPVAFSNWTLEIIPG